MSTALSMHSPHSHGTGAFATSLQLSPAFRSLHAAALRQRQVEFERLRELARSDEFSDDESDGDEEAELDNDEDEEDEGEEEDDVVTPTPLSTATPRSVSARESPRDAGTDSDIDAEETVLLPFIRPTVASLATTRAPHEAMSPKVDEWTIVDKSPTCEGLVFGNIRVSESWFSRP